MRYNPASSAGLSRAEQSAYESGHERIFGRRSTTTRRSTAARRSSSSSARGHSPAQKRARKREGVYRSLVSKGLSRTDAAKRAMRAVPFTKTQKKAGVSYKGLKPYAGKSHAVKRAKKKLPKQYAVGTATRKKKVVRTVRVRAKQRVAFGPYKRLRVVDPRTGKKRLSYLYKTKSGKRRHIPIRAIAAVRGKGLGAAGRAAARVDKIKRRRERAAAGIARRGGAFTPNKKRKKTMRANVSAARSAAGKKAWRTRKRRAAMRARGVGRGRGLAGAHLKPHRVYYRGRKPRRLRGVRARKLPRARVLLTNRRRRTHRRRRANASTPNRRRRTHRRRRNASHTATPNRRRRRRRAAAAPARRRRTHRRRRHANRRSATPNRRRRRRTHRRRHANRASATPNRRRRRHHRRSYRRNGRRSYRRNAGFWSAFAALAKAAIFVTVGFLAGKVLTRLLSDKLLVPMLQQQTSLAQAVPYAPIIAGVPVTLGGVFGAIMLAPKQAPEVGGGLIAAFLHTAIVTVLQANGQTEYAGYLAGVPSRSSAAAIGRHWTSDVRGLGRAPQRGILPRYRQLGPRGGMRQAVAGSMGEYISADGLGEYFASGVQGIGSYEQAGPMVTQAAAGLGQAIDDGVRPDGNLDQMFELMEAQAGLGEYFAARRNASGQTVEYTVGQRNTWIPGEGGPLWSGTAPAGDRDSTSEIPAGILETPGGNGVFG